MVDSIKLIPFIEENISQTYKWVCDDGLQHMFLMRGEMSWEKHVLYCDRMMSDVTQIVYAIFDEDNYIGNCGFKNIIEKTEGEFWIYIGTVQNRGKGIGEYVTKQIIKKGFGVFQFKKICLHVADFNIVALRMYKGLGFVEVPLKEDDNVWKNRKCKIIRMEQVGI